MTRRFSFLTACLLLTLPVSLAARADDDATTPSGTVVAVPSDNAPASVRDASAAVLRPAPMPGDTLAAPSSPPSGDDAAPADAPNFHPEIIGMRDNGVGGALSTASGDYDHAGRFRPAGGMGLTIPMQ